MRMNIKQIVLFMLVILFLGVFSSFAEEIDEPLVSNLFFYTDIREALSEITLQTGVNFIADDTVRGFVTLDLDEVPLEKALEMILLGGGYSYRKYDDYYLISIADPRSINFKHLTETEIINLEYITANEAMNLLPSVYDDFIRSSGERDVITIRATPEIIDSFKHDIKKLDTPENEIMIQVHITEISTELLKERGGDLFGFLRDEVDQTTDNYYQMLYDKSNFNYLFEQEYGAFEGRLRFLAQTEDVSIEANPHIRINDRYTAHLFLGEEQVIFLEHDDARARLERVNVGVNIRVTPQIINDNTMRLEINPQLSHFSEERQDRLVVKRSDLNTTVYAENGATLNLAGMTLSRETEFISSVPILGSIPVLRWLFREETERETERELIIFLTPEIIRK